MKTANIPTKKILLPEYITDCLKKVDWIESDDESINFYHDDFIMVLYGVRGSTAFSGPDHIRYGSNTTAYQVWSPKLPLNVLYLGDGGSGILEPSNVALKACFANGLNPFTASKEEISTVIKRVNNTYTHCHYDHLHMGTPLAGVFHANSIPKHIIGEKDIKNNFVKVFKRPLFPRAFEEIQASYKFQPIKEPRASVLVFTPDGDFKIMSSSLFENVLTEKNPQIKHNKSFYNVEDCLIVRCTVADHPDECISFRYENYNSAGEQQSAAVFMTDHETRESDCMNSYFTKHVDNSDVVYFDGQYSAHNYVPGFGHGRVELLGEIAAKLNMKNMLIGHHDPQRTDEEIDQMLQITLEKYNEHKTEGQTDTRIAMAADRMMFFIPSKERRRKGIVFGRMNFGEGYDIEDTIGIQSSVMGNYSSFDLTQTYQLVDQTTEDE